MLTRPRPTVRALRAARPFHASAARAHLVGPPDPISHIRPVIYDDAPPPPPKVRHPYSLREFTGDPREYQWKMQRQELEAFNHAFWTESNTRFNEVKARVLDSLPADATPEQREDALSAFYGTWVRREQARLDEYGAEWRRRNWTSITLAARVAFQNLMARIGGPRSGKSTDDV